MDLLHSRDRNCSSNLVHHKIGFYRNYGQCLIFQYRPWLLGKPWVQLSFTRAQPKGLNKMILFGKAAFQQTYKQLWNLRNKKIHALRVSMSYWRVHSCQVWLYVDLRRCYHRPHVDSAFQIKLVAFMFFCFSFAASSPTASGQLHRDDSFCRGHRQMRDILAGFRWW